jgi:hypothetical protein
VPKAQPVKDHHGHNRCLLWEPYATHTSLLNISSVRTSQRTHHVCYTAQPDNAVWGNSRCLLWEPYGTHHSSATQPNRIMLFGETWNTQMHSQIPNSVRTSQKTHHVCYTAQPDNAVWGNSRCLLWEPYGTYNTFSNISSVRTSQGTHNSSATQPNRLMLFGETWNTQMHSQIPSSVRTS